MDKAAIFHRPESEMGYLTKQNKYCVRLRTRHGDFARIRVIYGAPCAEALRNIEGNTWAFDQLEMTRYLVNGEFDYWEALLPVSSKHRIKYAFRLLDATDGEYLYDENALKIFNLQNVAQMRGFITPYLNKCGQKISNDWAQKTVWYRVMPDRFANGDETSDPKGADDWNNDPTKASLFGGDLQGIIDHLDHLQRLGFNGLYLTPVFSAYSGHKFDTIDFFQVDKNFGTKETLKKLVEAAHNRGMHVMMDICCDHLSDFSLEWQDVRHYSERSSYAKWFLIDKYPVRYVPSDIPDYAKMLTYEAVDDNPHQPRLNFENAEVQDMFSNVFRYWTRNFGIDAWCLNNADELPDSFKRRLKDELRVLDPSVMLVSKGRLKANDGSENVLDAVFSNSYSCEIADAFIKGDVTPVDLSDSQVQTASRRCSSAIPCDILEFDAPDTIRLIDACGGNEELLRSLLAFSFMQIQAPCFLYGTEDLLSVKAEEKDENSGEQPFLNASQSPSLQPTMKWEKEKQNVTMTRFVSHLTAIRRKYSEILTKGSFEWGQCSNKTGFITFTRRLGKQQLFCCFNLGYGSIRIVTPKNAKLLLSQNLMEKDSRLGKQGFVIVEI